MPLADRIPERIGVALLLTALLGASATAAPGDLDTTFSDDGWEQTDIRGTGAEDFGSDVVLQADGKIVVAGSTHRMGYTDFALARYNPDGTLDTTFDTDGIAHTSVSSKNDEALGVAIQSDGAIVAAGLAWVRREHGAAFALVRYLPDGTLDPVFGTNGIVRTNFTSRKDVASAVAIQADGKIVAAGWTLAGDFALARYNAIGHLDPSFSGDGKKMVGFGDAYAHGQALAIQTNGKIVVSGSIGRRVNNWPINKLALLRLRTDGRIDSAFGDNGRVRTRTGLDFHSSGGGGLEIQADGKIVVAGSASGTDYIDFLLVRYHRDGSKDRNFGRDGLRRIDIQAPEDTEVDFGGDLTIQPDGKIVEVGVTVDFDQGLQWVALARVHADGSIDTSFGDNGQVVTSFGRFDSASAVTLQPDGKIVIAGSTHSTDPGTRADFLIARYLS